MATEPKQATAATAAANEAALARYAMDDVEDFDTARRGLVAPLPEITNADGAVAYDVNGDAGAIDAYAAVVDAFDPDFAIVTP